MASWSCPSCPESPLLGLPPSANHFFLPPYCTHSFQLLNCGNNECIFKREWTTDTRDSGSNRGDTISLLSISISFSFFDFIRHLPHSLPLQVSGQRALDVSHFYGKPSHLSLSLISLYICSFSLCLCLPSWEKIKKAGFPLTVILSLRLSAAHCTKRLGVKA